MRKLVKLFLLFLALGVAFYFGKRATSPQSSLTKISLWEEEAGLAAPAIPVPAPGGRTSLELAEDVAEVFEAGGSVSERLVIKTGRLSLLVSDVRRSVEEITKVAEDEAGFVLSADVRRIRPESERLSGLVTIKVPSEKFNQIFSRIKDLGLKVASENVSGQDVTEEYTDLQSRWRNLEAAETQLLVLMKQAGKVTEILEVQKELVRTREEIERTKGRIEFLEKSSQMATITVNLATEEEELPVVEEGWRPRKVARAALRTLIRFWQGIGNGIIWVAVFLFPLVVLFLFVWVWRRIRGQGQT